MANLWYMLNGIKLFPSFAIDKEETAAGESVRMIGGNKRFWYRGDDVTFSLPCQGASEATAAEWRAATPRNATLTLTEPDGTNHAVRVVRRTFSIVESLPDVDGSPTATGPIFYDITIELEKLD